MKEEKLIPANYKAILYQIKQNIVRSQLKAAMAANNEMLWLYWQIGNEILAQQQTQGWGTKIIERLSKDIRSEFPGLKGFSPRNLLYMKQFASIFPLHIITVFAKTYLKITNHEFSQPPVAILQEIENDINIISQPPVAKLPKADFDLSPISRITWSHHIILINKVKDHKKAFWYMLNSIEHGISRDVLALQIESRLFERQTEQNKITNFKNTLPEPQSDLADYMMKDPYLFDFIQTKDKADERDIEGQLVKHITKFLLELGQGFAFLGQQYHLNVGDKDFYIDLLFYHTKLHCYVVVELKAGEFTPADTGQIGFYIAAVDGEIATPTDNPTIGILLCKSKNGIVAEYALKNTRSPIGVAEYKLSRAVPKNLLSKLPSIEEIENELKDE
jgi:predicted nuclease of restriction endonuclease-like (RecB) superfamily